jgi:large subunit ribosomal protein L29
MPTATEIAEFDTEELERQLSETRRELFNLRFQLATGQLDNFSRIRHVRKDVARMMTELRIREIAEAEGMTLDEIPIHQAAARRRTEDEALGRPKTTAAERRAAARAEAEEDVTPAIDEDELAEEIADDDGMPVVETAEDEVTEAPVAQAADAEAADAEEKRDG